MADIVEEDELAPGQTRLSCQGMSGGPLMSRRPWISTPGMPASRSASRSSTPSSRKPACLK